MKRLLFLILGIAIIFGAAILACLHIADSVSRDVAKDATARAGFYQAGGHVDRH